MMPSGEVLRPFGPQDDARHVALNNIIRYRRAQRGDLPIPQRTKRGASS
jgi:hypothetical protein